MISRQCPKCKTKWHSASTSEWTCSNCGATITSEHDVALNSATTEEGLECRIKFAR
jgi:ribosomal protein L37AE/L43A